MKIGNKIRGERASLDLSQMALSRIAGITRYKLSLIENLYVEPTNDELARIRKALAKTTAGSVKAAGSIGKRGLNHA